VIVGFIKVPATREADWNSEPMIVGFIKVPENRETDWNSEPVIR
jgi:hypothetical protein